MKSFGAFAGGVALLLLLAQPSRGELAVELVDGSSQLRNFNRPGLRDAHWLRVLPPSPSSQGGSETRFLVVWVPEAWTAGNASTPASVAQENVPSLAKLDDLLGAHGLADGDTLLKAARVVSLLRPVPAGEHCREVAPRYAGIWPLWRVLEEADCADSLSVAFSALQLLGSQGIEARLARYPSASGTAVFGVLLPRAAPTPTLAAPWAYPAGSDEILPVHPSLAPGAALQESEVVSWSWPEVLAAGWSPAVAAARAPAHAPRPVPDLCSQRRALGLPCAESPSWRNTVLNTFSAVILLSLAALAVGGLRRRRQRLARAAKRRAEARERIF